MREVYVMEYNSVKILKNVAEWKPVKMFEDNEIRIKYRRKGGRHMLYKTITKNAVPSKWTKIHLDDTGILTIQYTKEYND